MTGETAVRAAAQGEERGFPILVAGARIRALVVGGGAVAARKLSALLDGGVAHVRVVAPELSEALRGIAHAAGEDRVALSQRAYRAADLGDANLIVAATDVRAVNRQVAADADVLGRLCSVADAPADGAWTSMATHRTGTLVVAVAAGGVPTAAARVRDAIAARFDDRYGTAVGRLSTLRRRMLQSGDGDAWRDAAADLTDASFCEQVERGEIGGKLARWEGRGAWA